MKTVTLNKNNSSIILVDNTTEISLEQDHIKKGVERIYGIHKDNTTLHENVTEPTDWTSGKYIYDGEGWKQNPDWTDYSL